MKPIIIGIAGGSGAGKSTVCTALLDKYPGKIGLIQLDDYFKPSAPKLYGMDNWDHPDSLYLEKLASDIKEIKQGHPVTINTKNEKLNFSYKETEKRVPAVFYPKPIMLVEGYLVLHDVEIRKLLDVSIWLEVAHDIRWERRVHFKFTEYEERVLKPMHGKYVEPTKKYAENIIDVSLMSKEDVFKQVERIVLDRYYK